MALNLDINLERKFSTLTQTILSTIDTFKLDELKVLPFRIPNCVVVTIVVVANVARRSHNRRLVTQIAFQPQRFGITDVSCNLQSWRPFGRRARSALKVLAGNFTKHFPVI